MNQSIYLSDHPSTYDVLIGGATDAWIGLTWHVDPYLIDKDKLTRTVIENIDIQKYQVKDMKSTIVFNMH